MKNHSAKFNDAPMKRALNSAVGLARDAGINDVNPGKVRNGGVGGYRTVLHPHLEAAFRERWEQEVQPVTGYGSFAELRKGTNDELKHIISRA